MTCNVLMGTLNPTHSLTRCTVDPLEDQFEKRLKAKKETVAKNELQRLRNIARNMKGKGK